MKSFPFIVCIVAGLYVGYFIGKNDSFEVPAENMKQTEAITSIDENASEEIGMLRTQIVGLENELAGFRSEQASAASKEQEAKENWIAQRLRKFNGLSDLTSDQSNQIGELEWESSKYWELIRAGKIKVKDHPPVDLDAAIMELLTPEQEEIYELHLEERKKSLASTGASSTLGRYPVTLLLSEAQKNSIYENLYSYFHPDLKGEVNGAIKNTLPGEYRGMDQALIWAAKDVLEEEQFLALLQSLKK